MKNKIGLAFALFLIAPGVYAIVRWFVLDGVSQQETIIAYQSVLGFPELSFKKQIMGLLFMGMAGFYIAARSKDDSLVFLKTVRIVLLILGLAECMMLGFSLM